MKRTIQTIETSSAFWDDLKVLRKESWYTDLRKAIARFVIDLANGRPVQERGFTNPCLRGVMHVNLPRSMRLFHVYPHEDTVRLCIVADHRVYGFNGKHKGREATTAGRIWRAAEAPSCACPGWEGIRWRKPSDLVNNPELREMSSGGLQRLLEELEEEAETLHVLRRSTRIRDIDRIPEEVLDGWLEDIIDAQDCICATIESLVRERRQALRPDDFETWMAF